MLTGPAAYVAHDNNPNCEFKRNSGRKVELQVSNMVSTYMVLISWPSKVVRPINCHQLITAKYGADKERETRQRWTNEILFFQVQCHTFEMCFELLLLEKQIQNTYYRGPSSSSSTRESAALVVSRSVRNEMRIQCSLELHFKNTLLFTTNINTSVS